MRRKIGELHVYKNGGIIKSIYIWISSLYYGGYEIFFKVDLNLLDNHIFNSLANITLDVFDISYQIDRYDTFLVFYIRNKDIDELLNRFYKTKIFYKVNDNDYISLKLKYQNKQEIKNVLLLEKL